MWGVATVLEQPKAAETGLLLLSIYWDWEDQ